ncbi:unnamed protein product, partial [Coregonus sp. 'balchen']
MGDPKNQDYDVALLQLCSPLLLTEHAQSVCLPCSGQEAPPSQVCMFSLWEGQTGEGGLWGGPLVCQTEDSGYFVLGVISRRLWHVPEARSLHLSPHAQRLDPGTTP